MGLRFPGVWRFTPPPDGQFINSAIPEPAVWEMKELVLKVANQGGRRWDVIEHFKKAFGMTSTSSNENWAESDLSSAMQDAAENAPVFIEQLYNGLEQLRSWADHWYVPDVVFLNGLLGRHNIGYEIRLPDLVTREAMSVSIPVVVPEPSLEERSRARIHASLLRSEELLSEDRPREAVQESLWLLESVATAFRGIDTRSGKIEGKYFNQIVRDLRAKHTGSTLEQVLTWIFAMHGYLSSPTGGGVRHGADLERGVDLDHNEGRLLCNLIRSYVQFLLIEHDSIVRPLRK